MQKTYASAKRRKKVDMMRIEEAVEKFFGKNYILIETRKG